MSVSEYENAVDSVEPEISKTIGTVKYYHHQKRYGVVVSEVGDEAWVSVDDLPKDMRCFCKGDVLAYDEVFNTKGDHLKAINVDVVALGKDVAPKAKTMSEKRIQSSMKDVGVTVSRAHIESSLARLGIDDMLARDAEDDYALVS